MAFFSDSIGQFEICIVLPDNSSMKSMKARVAAGGRVTIPKRLRESLGVKPGTVLKFSEERGRLIAVKIGSSDQVGEVQGHLGTRIHTDAVITQLRRRL
ncbi:MAG: AbrB/MazE/SpoVT family DNA-binding domain-containing protein [Candidatus Binatus sp.]|uniref:AbrB/MazE/SpoVT family DNA-binding domain-containing protein n=1 Tax=Candidatus Binatus sp. TaxID=2811406 RepID=UPI002722DE27|nr:AbrB/MazE/SpoVT family DNA-binding domain-containing protein [Candidatus Binatus sp.]MDO8434524.1 AbrB/MazE/SpoVT family DNA-binding domain-containing protein [Candidatus Binatus sp.]